jgi:Spy/CpxP family protein refolding chaperone
MAEPPIAPARASRTTGTLVLLAAFLLGMISGAALFHAGQRSMRPDGFERRGPGFLGRGGREPVERLAREADLTPDQRRAVEAILRETREEMRAVGERSRERMRGVLTPAQMEKVDALRPRRGRDRRRDRRPRRDAPLLDAE